jgi:hypothetical protein
MHCPWGRAIFRPRNESRPIPLLSNEIDVRANRCGTNVQTLQDFLVLGENILRVQPHKVFLVRPAVKQIRARNQPRNILVPETGDPCHHQRSCLLDGRVHSEACGFPSCGCIRRDQEPSLEGIEFVGFPAGTLQQILELGDRLPSTFSRLVPLQVIAALGMVFVTACATQTWSRTILPLCSTTDANGHLEPSLILLMILTRSAYCFALAMQSKPS